MILSARERSLLDQVSSDKLMATTAGIARWVRLSGSDGERRAIDYVRELLDSYGLETETVLHDAYISLPLEAWIELPDGRRLPAITHSFSASTGPEGVSGAVTPWAEINHLRGAIALLDGLTMPGRVLEVEAAGAAAQIYVHGDLTHEMIVSPVWGNPDPRTVDQLPRTPILSIDSDTAEDLRAALAGGAQTLKVHTRVDTGWRQTPILTANLAAPDTSDFVLFSGHIDSWHYGAMDNGTANAAMVEVARLMSAHRDRLRRGLRLAFWSGHSHGRYSGSAWYADNHWLELRRHCLVHVNVDSLGGRGATVLSEGIAMASTRELAGEAIAAVSGQEFGGSRVSRAGDQSFVGLGVPSLWMSLSEQPAAHDPTADAFAQLVGQSRSGGLGWWWHTTEDTLDKIDPDYLLRDARIYTRAIDRLLSDPVLPLDAAAEARELLALLDAQSSGAVDLSPALELATELVRRTEAMQARMKSEIEGVSAESIRTYNRALSGVLREIIPVNYTLAGPFGHDTALSVPALPSLHQLAPLADLDPQSDEARFLSVEVTQGRNRVLDALDRALGWVDQNR